MVDRKRRLDCANGIRKADIVLKHGKVLNVFTEEILDCLLYTSDAADEL